MKKDHFEVILEDINSKIDVLVEVVVPMQQDVSQLKLEMIEVNSRLNTIEGVLRVNSADITELKAKSHAH